MCNINNTPLKIYKNAKLDKLLIISENKNKIGIYCLTNIKNGRKYVGMSINLDKRLSNYYQNSFLNKKSGLIMPAIKNYGHYFFRIEILEYCESSIIRERESYYINSIKSDYNIRGTN
jgi:group I intron endonuclease